MGFLARILLDTTKDWDGLLAPNSRNSAHTVPLSSSLKHHMPGKSTVARNVQENGLHCQKSVSQIWF